MISTDDVDDPRLDDFRALSTADRRPDRPGGRGFVIAEGVVVVRRLLASAYPVRAVLGVPRRLDELAADLDGMDVPAYSTSAGTMAEVVGFHLNRGVLAVADKSPQPTVAELVARARVVAVLEGIGDHENLGSIFRSAAALGVDAVLLGPGCADPLYRRSVRVSMGNVLRVPFGPLTDWPGGLEWLRAQGFRIAALTPRPGSVTLRSVGDEVSADKAGAGDEGKVALLLGSEGPGLSEEALAVADVTARIPMAEGVDSLNVATAAAVAFYELGGPG